MSVSPLGFRILFFGGTSSKLVPHGFEDIGGSNHGLCLSRVIGPPTLPWSLKPGFVYLLDLPFVFQRTSLTHTLISRQVIVVFSDVIGS